MHATSTLSLYFSYTLENECMCGICIQFSELCTVTGTCHVVSSYMFFILFIARCQENMQHGTEIILFIG